MSRKEIAPVYDHTDAAVPMMEPRESLHTWAVRRALAEVNHIHHATLQKLADNPVTHYPTVDAR